MLEQIPDKADITSYVKIKLGLVQTEEPQSDSPEVCQLMKQMARVQESYLSAHCIESSFQRSAPSQLGHLLLFDG